MRVNGFQSARLLIVEPSYYLAHVIRSQLKDVGFRRIDVVADTAYALSNLDSLRYDAVLCDADGGTLPPLEFAKIARRGRGRTDPYFCLLMLSHRPTVRKVGACRDAGANAFLLKPVSATNLRDKLIAGLSGPRRFVESESFFGPDRRRGLGCAPLAEDRRTPYPSAPEFIVAPRMIAA